MKWLKILLVLFSFILLDCQKKSKSDSPLELVIKSTALVAASTSYRCQINAANNSEYFVPNSIPSGGSASVGRIQAFFGNVAFDIYYPQDSSTSLPILVLFQGGNVHSSFYSKYAARIASSGYVVFVANRCDLFIVEYFLYSPASLTNKVMSIAEVQNSLTGSLLYQKMNLDSVGLLGHSLGGVVGLFAMNNICEFPFCDAGYSFVSKVKAGIFYGSGLGANFDSNRFYKTSSGKGIPTGYIQGTLDGANSPTSGLGSYNSAIATKAYFTVQGANHYSITDVSNPFGAKVDPNIATLSQTDGIAKIAETSIIFLDAYLKGSNTHLLKITSDNLGISGVSATSAQ